MENSTQRLEHQINAEINFQKDVNTQAQTISHRTIGSQIEWTCKSHKPLNKRK